MIFYVGASTPHTWKPFSEAIKWYAKKPYSHVYFKYEDPFTNQVMISESSRGEKHHITYDNWRIINKEVMLFEIDLSEELFRAILIHSNNTLQTSYSIKNILGILFYDAGLHWLAKKFNDGTNGLICSEDVSFILRLMGINFKKPYDFIRPDEVVNKMLSLAKTETYIKRVL